VESQQKNVKDQHAQVKKKFVKSNEDVDTNAQLADQKLRNAKALALVKEKERIAKEQIEQENQKVLKEKMRQEKELEQKISREVDAQNQKKSNKSNNNMELLMEVEEVAVVPALQSKNSQKKQIKATNSLAKKGAAYTKKPAKKMHALAKELSSNNYLVGGIVFCVIFALVVIFFVPNFIQ